VFSPEDDVKKFAVNAALTVIIAGFALFLANCTKEDEDKVTLIMGSWQTLDAVKINNLLAEYEKINPDVIIKFKPVNASPDDLYFAINIQLDNDAGPDLIYAHSYEKGQELFNSGYYGDCSDIPGVKENFTFSVSSPWQTDDGRNFAVPFAAVSHAVYYNKTTFEREGLSVPKTWEDFLKICEYLASKGYTPLANGTADEWDIMEVFFLGILNNYIGGAEERIKYESGEKKLNDDAFTAAFQAMADLAKYMPKNFETVTYNDSQALFNTKQAVMIMDGSWALGAYDNVKFEWGLFAMPAPEGKNTVICFHPDMAITWNTNTKYPKECKDFLAWLASLEGAAIASASLSLGLFPMINQPIQLENPHANEFLNLNSGKETDARFLWPKFMDLHTLMNKTVIQVVNGGITPRQAADAMETAAANLR
jgi:raffinose/stachyose/melibiose transport system substrate-binding protein